LEENDLQYLAASQTLALAGFRNLLTTPADLFGDTERNALARTGQREWICCQT
jgi:hypothetical protein